MARSTATTANSLQAQQLSLFDLLDADDFKRAQRLQCIGLGTKADWNKALSIQTEQKKRFQKEQKHVIIR